MLIIQPEAAELAKMAEIIGAVNDLTAANNTNSANLLAKLEQLLTDKGIYYDENNAEQMYMTPENFAAIQDAGVNSNVYKTLCRSVECIVCYIYFKAGCGCYRKHS